MNILLFASFPDFIYYVLTGSFLLQSVSNCVSCFKSNIMNKWVKPYSLYTNPTSPPLGKNNKCCSESSDISTHWVVYYHPGTSRFDLVLLNWQCTSVLLFCPENDMLFLFEWAILRTWNSLPSGDMKVWPPSILFLILQPAGSCPPTTGSSFFTPVLDAGPGVLLAGGPTGVACFLGFGGVGLGVVGLGVLTDCVLGGLTGWP